MDADGRFPEDGPIVDVAWLRARLGAPGLRLVDARPAPAYAAAHLPGAVHLDLYGPALKLADSSPEAIARFDAHVAAELRRVGVRPGERVVFYEDVSGPTAARGVWLLDYAGLGGGALLDGGLRAWAAAGGPTTRAVPPPDPSDLDVAPDRARLATAAEIRAGLDGPGPDGPVVLDARDVREHRAGTIPGALHLDWLAHLRPDGTLRPPAELRARYAAAGLPPDPARRVVAFCGSGYRSAHAYVVLRALGHPDLANYAPSWGEWGRRPDLPVALPGRAVAEDASAGREGRREGLARD